MIDNFCCFIASHGRADKVYTHQTLRKHGYTGPIYVVIDNLDTSASQYTEKYGDKVVIFNKEEMAKRTDMGDNFWKLGSIIHARNACFDIAQKLGHKYFLVLDDDYYEFRYAFGPDFRYSNKSCWSLDAVIGSTLKFYKSVPNLLSIAFAQGGDFIGGEQGSFGQGLRLRRKCMNSFFCSTERPYKFIGSVNEDVNTYTNLGSRGGLFFTMNNILLNQKDTQSNSGGMTDLYEDSGTYIKSFYSVLFQPSSVFIKQIGTKHKRLHHSISWKNTVPCILSEAHRKASAVG